MMEPEEIRLQRMGLSKLEEKDTFLEHEDEWGEKKKLYDELVKSELFETKPKGTYFEIAENPGDKAYVPCHLMIPVMIIEATVKNTNKLSTNKSKAIAAEYTWAMEEAAEWSKEYLTFDEVKTNGELVPLKIASDPETYAVLDYSEYIPLHVRNAEEKYKKIYFDKHIKDHTGLKMEMIDYPLRSLRI